MFWFWMDHFFISSRLIHNIENLILFKNYFYYWQNSDKVNTLIYDRGLGKMRVKVLLICAECLSRNYVTTIKKDGDKKLELMKYCKKCNKQTLHKVSK